MTPSAEDLPPGYPVEWEADVLLSDGRTAHLRPIRPDDAVDLVEFYDRVSAESKYLRFFVPYPRLSASDVLRFTVVDYVDRVALIVTVAGELLAIGRFDRINETQAEVAFLVEDAHQGRGIAQLLLEHLAEAARERGVSRFVAEVLPQNRRMVSVFADAGYRIRQDVEDGVITVDFPILPTDTAVGVMERREHRAEGASMRRLLHPTSVVVLGPGARVQVLVGSLLASGYRGAVTAVSSDGVPVSGVPTAATVSQVEGEIDLLLSAVPPAALGDAVIEAAHKRAHAVVELTGSRIEPEDSYRLVTLARAYGLRAVGPDALGVINTASGTELNATPAPMPRAGGVGLFCQSAAVGIGLLNTAHDLALGISSFVSTGDFADVTANDVMQYWEDDDATRVCLLSLDSIGNPRKFSRIIRRLARRKPVIVFQPGRADRSAHAGDRGGLTRLPPAAVDALFRQSGVLVMHRRDAMFDIAKVLTRQPLPAGHRIGLVTNSPTLHRQARHSAESFGLTVDATVLDPDVGEQQVVHVAGSLLDGPDHDAVLCAFVGAYSSSARSIHHGLETLAEGSTKPLLAVFLDFDQTVQTFSGPDRMGTLPAFPSIADAVQALAEASRYARWRERDEGAVPLWEHDVATARRVVNLTLADAPAGRELTPDEARELLHAFGIRVVPEYRVDTWEHALERSAALGWNVVLKATSGVVRGRTDLAGVYRNINSETELAEAWHELGRLVSMLGVDVDDGLAPVEPVIQAMMPVGVSLTVESREDTGFGPILKLGLEGLASELLDDVVYRVPPLTTGDAQAMVRNLRSAPVLFGSYGGSPPVDVEALEQLLHRVAQLADTLPQLASVRLGPCIVSPTGVSVLRATIMVAPTADQRDPMARSLG